jgi:peroxiredoxin
MKIFFTVVFNLLFVSLCISQVNVELAFNDALGNETLNVYTFNGAGFTSEKTVSPTNGKWIFTLPKTKSPKMYFIGTSEINNKGYYFGTEDKVIITGSINSFQGTSAPTSKLNRLYESTMGKVYAHKELTNSVLNNFYQSTFNAPKEQPALRQNLVSRDSLAKVFMDSMLVANPFIGKIVAINTNPILQGDPKTTFNDETQYLGLNFFKNAKLSDPDYNNIPAIFEAFKSFTMALYNGAGFDEALYKDYLNYALSLVPDKTDAHKMALGGVVAALEEKNHGLVGAYTKEFLEKYAVPGSPLHATMSAKVNKMKTFITGETAPDFVQADPDGKNIKLSDFRGKVLLVDFWASWCGPCRKENPNVVKVYNQYRDKGLEILGVSLDQDKARWMQAIQADGLPWKHVSDLKGWRNDAAALYGVTSIPSTLLLDKSGKILARNLRGADLERKIAEVLGAN